MAPTTGDGDNRRRGQERVGEGLTSTATTGFDSATHNHHQHGQQQLQLREDGEHVDDSTNQKTTTTTHTTGQIEQTIAPPRRSSLLSEVGSVASWSSTDSQSQSTSVKLQLPSRHPNWRPSSSASSTASRSTSPPPASLSSLGSLSSRRGAGAGRARGLGPLSRFEPPEREREVEPPRTGASSIAAVGRGQEERSVGEEVLKEQQRKDGEDLGLADAKDVNGRTSGDIGGRALGTGAATTTIGNLRGEEERYRSIGGEGFVVRADSEDANERTSGDVGSRAIGTFASSSPLFIRSFPPFSFILTFRLYLVRLFYFSFSFFAVFVFSFPPLVFTSLIRVRASTDVLRGRRDISFHLTSLPDSYRTANDFAFVVIRSVFRF
ncbi:hypothetical protein SCHPADRAFT_687241 [Schizopora paradoxa]|uniref:Uncharacterized protein n=1 Tax=Schizopora paradoxa TaxID=27342 RepID=A0A0H2RP13_9AGAM|nr:hypothetical protein SCHPADRAFT_687241 [Schizopora paradoxa]